MRPIAHDTRCLAEALLILAILPVTTAGASAARVEDAAKDAVYECPLPAPTEIAGRATALGLAQWDKNSLGCAADLWYALAAAAGEDPMLGLQALLAATSYVDHVNTLWSFDLYSIRQAEWTARIEHASQQGRALETRLAALPAEDANVLAARALWKLTWPSKFADTKTQLAETRAAQGLLVRATALDPKALDGNALWLLARLYYDLPEFAGGDAAKAIKLLDDAYRSTPGNPSLLRYSAYVYIEERDLAAARARLTAMLALVPGEDGLQLLADELRGARDLATRIKDAPLATRLNEKRDGLLKAHPQLLTRLATAANLHGGVDPITGKDY